MRFVAFCVCSIVLLVLGEAEPLAAQHTGQTQRAVAPSVEALGRGDVGAALPERAHPFSYNPAHSAALPTQITAFRIQGAGSGHVADPLRHMSRGGPGEILNGEPTDFDDDFQTFADSTRRVGARPSILEATIALPSFVYRRGPYAVSGGATVHSLLNQRFRSDGPDAIPIADHRARTDVTLSGTVGYDASAHVPGLRLGVTLNALQRYVSTLERRIDRVRPTDKMPVVESTPLLDQLTFFDSRAPQNPVWVGRNVSFDVGAMYTVSAFDLPGTLHVGAAAFDLWASEFTFSLQDTAPRIPLLGPLLPDQSPPVVNGRVSPSDPLSDAQAERFQIDPSVRVGAAYTQEAWGPFRNLAVAVDYQDYRRPSVEQSALAHLHVGAEAQYDILIARLGINQGYPTAGVGLRMGHIHVDYAFYGREEGSSFRETYNYVNTLQVALRF